jgi:DNA (cytosine-5)-methyltransferase 1
VAHTLRGEGFDASEDGTGRGTPLVAQSFNWQQGDAEYSLRDDTTALAADSRPGVLIPEPQAFRKSARAQSVKDDESWVADGQTAEALTRTSDDQRMPDKSRFQAVVHEYGVRRLTPVECERLQAFPDGWTEPAVSDSARYKALGNAVTVNTVRWVLGRMLEQT